MKKLLSFLVITTLLFGCKPKEDNTTTLTGTVDNLESGSFILQGPGGVKDSVFLTDDNTFKFVFEEITEPGNYYFVSDNDYFNLHVAPGMQLDVYFDKSNFKESINFAGPGSDINNYLADKARNEGDGGFKQEPYTRVEAAFVAWADSGYTAKKTLLEEYPKENPDDPFWKTEEANLLYGWAQEMINYPSYYKYFNEGEEIELSENYDSYKDKLDVNRPEYLGSAAYKSYINTYVREKANEAAANEEVENRNLLNLKTAVTVLTDPKIRDNFMVEAIMGRMQWNELDEIKDEIEFFKQNCTDSSGLAKFSKEYEAWLTLDAGQPAIDFVGEDLEGNMVSLSDFKGKYVYVDVWATWCGPCKYEIPYLKKLEADYHGRNIEFISYSIDDDKQAWLDFVPENELGGVQLIGEAAWQSDLAKNYKIMGVPTFMFFGPDGKIISVKMSRPSDEATRERFDSYSDL